MKKFEEEEKNQTKAKQETNDYLKQIISKLILLGFNSEDVQKLVDAYIGLQTIIRSEQNRSIDLDLQRAS